MTYYEITGNEQCPLEDVVYTSSTSFVVKVDEDAQASLFPLLHEKGFSWLLLEKDIHLYEGIGFAKLKVDAAGEPSSEPVAASEKQKKCYLDNTDNIENLDNPDNPVTLIETLSQEEAISDARYELYEAGILDKYLETNPELTDVTAFTIGILKWANTVVGGTCSIKLSSVRLGELLGKHPASVRRTLKRLVDNGIIKRIKEGNNLTGTASEYELAVNATRNTTKED